MSTKKETLKNRILLIHVIVYIFVNAGMYAINIQFTPTVTWFVYPLIGWGIGLALHALFFAGIGGREQSAKSIRTKAFVAHLIVYLMVNILLLVVNLTYTPTFLWIAFPAAGWGLAVILHFLFGVVFPVKEN